MRRSKPPEVEIAQLLWPSAVEGRAPATIDRSHAMHKTGPEPTFSSLIVDDEPTARMRLAQRPAFGPTRWWIALIALAIAGAAIFYWWRQQQAPSAPPTEAPQAKVEAPPEKAEPSIRHPIDDARARAGLDAGQDRELVPALSASDAIVREKLAGVPGAAGFERFFYPQDIVRRFVATVDNLPRKSVAAQVMVVKPVPGSFLTGGTDGKLTIGRDNEARYAPYVRLVQAVDTKMLVALYVRFYPWFQQAYQELGYPSGYFNDRLIDVIDNVLAAPDISAPVALVQPHVLYQFANPDLEALSAGQKMMLRMGSENASHIRIELRELRGLLTGVTPS
jgi:hypothetical protein